MGVRKTQERIKGAGKKAETRLLERVPSSIRLWLEGRISVVVVRRSPRPHRQFMATLMVKTMTFPAEPTKKFPSDTLITKLMLIAG